MDDFPVRFSLVAEAYGGKSVIRRRPFSWLTIAIRVPSLLPTKSRSSVNPANFGRVSY